MTTDEDEKVGLINGERMIERRSFFFGIAKSSSSRREVDPVRPLARLARAGDIEMRRCRLSVGAGQGVGAEPITRRRLFSVDRQHGFEMRSCLVAVARAYRALRFGEMVVDRQG